LLGSQSVFNTANANLHPKTTSVDSPRQVVTATAREHPMAEHI
jgi:hypothetical protein